MSKKDLFRLIIKIFGLYSVVSIVFSLLPNNALYVLKEIDPVGIVWLICSLIVIILLFMFLIYKPDKIIRWLKLDKGFDEDWIDFQYINNSSILKLAVIVIGGIVLIQNIPAFLSHTLFAFKSSIGNGPENNYLKYSLKDNIRWAVSFINIIIGYLMLTKYSYIIKVLKEKKTDENESAD